MVSEVTASRRVVLFSLLAVPPAPVLGLLGVRPLPVWAWLLFVFGGALAVRSSIMASLALAAIGLATLVFACTHKWGGFESGGLAGELLGLVGIVLLGLGLLGLIVSALRTGRPKDQRPPRDAGSNDL